MKLNNILIAGALATMVVFNTGCAEDYQELNQDPANVTKTLPDGLLAAAINEFQPTDYTYWFYNVNYFTRWNQMGTPGGGFGDDFTGVAELGGQGGQYISTLKYRNKIKDYIAVSGETKYNGYLAASGILTIYLGIFDTDMYGSIPYTEACHYDDLGIITPKYDSVESLYTLWISELNEFITLLQDNELEKNSKQDPAYGCDWDKWAKLANSLKLKIAVRLYNNDATAALAIVNEAASNRAGLMTETSDDLLFAKAISYNSGNSDYVYGTSNGLATQYATDKVMNFMLGSKDPRVRFIYAKNGFNSKVVQSFIDNGKYDDLPSQVKANVVRDAEGNFEKWGGMGEPWVRYTSIPVTYSPKISHDNGTLSDADYEEYFNSGLRYQVSMTDANGDDKVKSYNPFSYYSHEMRRGRVDFSLPTAMSKNANGEIDMNTIQDTDDNPLYQMYVGAGEINLYLAEFAVLNGGSIAGKTAEEWYNAGVKASVEEFNTLAAKNKIPYYGTTYDYDPNEKVIDLVPGEIDDMLATNNVKLNGTKAEQLEKIYLQQLINFSEQPDDQFITSRRSGYPKLNSSLLPFVKFPGIELSAIPRRFVISEPQETDLMYSVKKEAYTAQGFKTLGTNSQGAEFNASGNAPLNVERVWQDKNAPQWATPNN